MSTVSEVAKPQEVAEEEGFPKEQVNSSSSSKVMPKILRIIIVTNLKVPIEDVNDCESIISEVMEKFKHLDKFMIELRTKELDGDDGIICEALVGKGRKLYIDEECSPSNN